MTTCQFAGYPESYGRERQVFAIVVAVATLVSIVGGFALAFLRRKHRLIASRDWSNSIIFTAGLLLSLEVPFRELFGEAAMPCAAYYLVIYVDAGLLPAAMAARFVGLYTRHVLQRKAVRLVRVSSSGTLTSGGLDSTTATRTDTYGDEAAQLPSRHATPVWMRGFYAVLDRTLIAYRMNTAAGQVAFVCCSLVPWAIYYVIRMSLAQPYRSADAVGCRVDTLDISLMVCVGVLYVGLLSPLMLPLLHSHDNLLLRLDLGANTLTASPLLLWFFVFKYVWWLDVYVLNGGYAMTFEGIIVLWSSLWVPALWSFREAERDAPAEFRHELGRPSSGSSITVAVVAEVVEGREDTTTASAVTETEIPGLTEVDELGGDASGGVRHSIGGSRAVSFTGVAPSKHRGTRVEPSPQEVHTTAASVAGRLAAFQLVSPSPSVEEVGRTLQLEPSALLASARSLRIVAALLVAVPSGQVVLRSVLAAELCGELLSFLVRSAELRRALGKHSSRVTASVMRISALLASPAAAGDGGVARHIATDAHTPAAGETGDDAVAPEVLRPGPRRSIHVGRRKSIAAVHPLQPASEQAFLDAPMSTLDVPIAPSHEPEPARQLSSSSVPSGHLYPAASRPTLEGEDIVRVIADSHDDIPGAFTHPDTTTRRRHRAARVSAATSAAAAVSCSALCHAADKTEALVGLFVTPGAQFEVNISASCSRQLTTASAALRSAARAAATAASPLPSSPTGYALDEAAAAARQGIRSIIATRAALRAAEHDVFIIVACGPVFRLLGGGLPAHLRSFKAWVLSLLVVLQGPPPHGALHAHP